MSFFQEGQATVSITEKGGNERQMELFWTKDNISTVDRVSVMWDNQSYLIVHLDIVMDIHVWS